MKKNPGTIIISRTDSIGDMVLALPAAKILKDFFPGIKVAFMGKQYVKAVADACEYADAFIDVADFHAQEILIDGKKPDAIVHFLTNKQNAERAKTLHIPLRIGTISRIYHLITCNRFALVRRKNSPLHEAQLNLKLLKPLGIKKNFSFNEIASSYGFTKFEALQHQYATLIHPGKFNIIIHPKSQGNAREWPLSHFINLIKMLDENLFNIFISGTENERKEIEPLFEEVRDKVTDIMGKINLAQFISFINACDAVITNSTGPLHLAAAMGKNAIGLYPPLKPKHAARWGPIGKNTKVFVHEKNCSDCRNDKNNCSCMIAIEPVMVKTYLNELAIEKFPVYQQQI